MTGAETLEAALRGPLGSQHPRRGGTFGSDVWLSLAVAALLSVGVLMVLDVSYFHAEDYAGDPYFFFRKHVASIGLGLVAAWGVSLIPSDVYRRAAYPALALALLALVVVLIPGVGVVRGGAQRWFWFGGQPSEFAKLALILYLACSLARKRDRMHDFARGVLPHCLVVVVMAALLLKEPDFGSAVLTVALAGVLLFVGGARLTHLGATAAAAVPVLAVVMLLEPYRWKRLMAFVSGADERGVGWQLIQSLIAFGSGGVLGRGIGESQQKLYFLPAAHTDFILAIIGEEFGLIGGLAVLGLFAVVAARGLRIAARHPQPFGRLLACGLTTLLVLQAILNFGVVLGTFPTKGLVLPFISYGGTAMLLTLIQVGMLLALAREAR